MRCSCTALDRGAGSRRVAGSIDDGSCWARSKDPADTETVFRSLAPSGLWRRREQGPLSSFQDTMQVQFAEPHRQKACWPIDGVRLVLGVASGPQRNCVLTSCGKGSLLGKVMAFRFAISVSLVVSNPSQTLLCTLSVLLSPTWKLGLGKDGKAAVPAAVPWTKTSGTTSARKWIRKSTIFTSERSEGILNVKIGRRCEPLCHEPTWKEDEEKMSGLAFKLEGNLHCALTGKWTSDDLSEDGERSGARRVYCDGRLGVRRFDRFFPIRQDEPRKDRQGNWKHACPYYR